MSQNYEKIKDVHPFPRKEAGNQLWFPASLRGMVLFNFSASALSSIDDFSTFSMTAPRSLLTADTSSAPADAYSAMAANAALILYQA